MVIESFSFCCKTWLPPCLSCHFSVNNLCIVTVSFTQKAFNHYVTINEYVVVRNLTFEILSKRIFTSRLGKADRIFTEEKRSFYCIITVP